jgi:hypothetical protein
VRLGSRNGIVTKLKGIVDGWVMRHRVVGHGFDGPEVTSANRLMAEFLMLAVYGAGEARGARLLFERVSLRHGFGGPVTRLGGELDQI